MNQVVQAPVDDRKPNWSKWRLFPEVKVWQAVALSLDIDPDRVKQKPNEWMGSARAFNEGRDFKDRFDIACANVGRGHALIPVRYPAGHPGSYPVRVQKFAAWCLSIDWSIPNELRDLARSSTHATAPGQSSVTDAAPLRETPASPDAPIPTASSERTHDPLKACPDRSVSVTVADDYFREQDARLAAQVAKFANEAGYAQLVASVDAKDLHLNLAPDWPHWANMAYVTVSDAACLSLGINPEARLPEINLFVVRERAQAANAKLARVELGVAALERAQRMIQQRIEQAMSAIEAGRLPSALRNIPQMLGLAPSPTLVSLPRYRRWEESLPEPYVFPEGFPPAEPHSAAAVCVLIGAARSASHGRREAARRAGARELACDHSCPGRDGRPARAWGRIQG